MEIELYYLLLVATGLIAGFINTLAGGGSSLTLPVLMIMGMPADVANATNRVGVMLHNIASAESFRRHGKMDSPDLLPIVAFTILGGLLGGLAASYLPVTYLKPVLLISMVTMALIVLLRPDVVVAPPGTPERRVAENPKAWFGLLLAGFYGGFIQAGVGFILIAVIAGTLRYDIVRTSAIKMACGLVFTAVALSVFILRGQVDWSVGLILAMGTVVGGLLGVKAAIKVSQRTLKWVLFMMTLVVCVAAALR